MLNVESVWRSGITGAGVHVRINDDGGKHHSFPMTKLTSILLRRSFSPFMVWTVDASHPEFANFDIENSCDMYLPEISIADYHGTACASIIGAVGNNGECAVVSVATENHD